MFLQTEKKTKYLRIWADITLSLPRLLPATPGSERASDCVRLTKATYRHEESTTETESDFLPPPSLAFRPSVRFPKLELRSALFRGFSYRFPKSRLTAARRDEIRYPPQMLINNDSSRRKNERASE